MKQAAIDVNWKIFWKRWQQIRDFATLEEVKAVNLLIGDRPRSQAGLNEAYKILNEIGDRRTLERIQWDTDGCCPH